MGRADQKEKSFFFVLWLRYMFKFFGNCERVTMNSYCKFLKANLAGLFFVGMIGYIVRVIHIPINNIIAGTE